jgi:uncharacterized membrane protein YqjE
MSTAMGTGGTFEDEQERTVQHERDVSQASVGQLVGEVAGDLSTLMRQELDLAKAELREEAKKGGKAAGMLGGAGLAGWMLLLFLSLTLMWWLDDAIHTALAALIVAAIWGAVAAVLYATGRKQLREFNPKPEQTVESVKEDVQWAKHRNR